MSLVGNAFDLGFETLKHTIQQKTHLVKWVFAKKKLYLTKHYLLNGFFQYSPYNL